MNRKSFNAWLEVAAGDSSTGLRFIDRRERAVWLSWRELGRRAERVAGGLARLGVERGECVPIVYPTCPEFFAAFFGVLRAGAVPVPLYPPVRLGRLDEYHARTAAMLRAVAARLVLADTRVRRLLGLAIEGGRPLLGCRTLDELPVGAAPQVDVDAEDLALVQFSSGTTLDPKPVALTHGAVMAQVEALNHFWPDEGEVRHTGVSWLPLYHDMGLIGCVFPALERPSVLTLIPPELVVAQPAVWLRTLSRYRATISPAPNFAYALCVERIRDEELEGVDLSEWRVALNGAETVVPEVMRAFAERFARWGFRRQALTPVYGLSEAALAVTFAALDRPPTARRFRRDHLSAGEIATDDDGGREIASVGRPLPGFALEVRDRAGRPLAERVVGRLWVRGPSLMKEYLGRPDATAEVKVDGWLDTGDLGFLLDGELFLTGRAKEMILARGKSHAPEELEGAVDGLPGVRRGCVVAASHLPEGAVTESVLLFVEHRRRAAAADLERLPELCRQEVRAATGLELDDVRLLSPGTLPRTSSGKLRRQEALRRHLAAELTSPATVGPLQLVGELARSRRALRRTRSTQR